jgi:hypothetical protein
VKVNVKEVFRINKDKMMLAKIESWQQMKNIMLKKLKERKGEKTYIDRDLTNKERKTQKKLREVAREERDRGKRVKIGYRKIQINGEWFISDETRKKFRRRAEKKGRQTSEKRYKKKVNKKVGRQRKRKLEKKHKGESRYRKSTNGKVKGQKEKRKREDLPGE